MSVRPVKELKVKRYSSLLQVSGDADEAHMVADAEGPFVMASEVRAKIKQLIGSGRLSPETATRLITSLGL